MMKCLLELDLKSNFRRLFLQDTVVKCEESQAFQPIRQDMDFGAHRG